MCGIEECLGSRRIQEGQGEGTGLGFRRNSQGFGGPNFLGLRGESEMHAKMKRKSRGKLLRGFGGSGMLDLGVQGLGGCSGSWNVWDTQEDPGRTQGGCGFGVREESPGIWGS